MKKDRMETPPLRKRGQLHITETIAVLFIFFVLVFFGLLFYSKYQKISLAEKQEELLGERAMETTLKTLFLPELGCSKGEAEQEDNCIDLMKLEAAQKTFSEHINDYYFGIFSYANITVQELYPDSARSWTLYDKLKTKTLEDGTVVKDWERKEPTYFVVTLRDESQGGVQYRFGYIVVEVYS